MSNSDAKQFGFETTQWSLVLAAGEQVGLSQSELLSELCQRYWRPLYGFARRSGRSVQAAEDSVQAFFVHLLSGDALAMADRDRGRFRTFLLSSLQNFMRNEHARSNTIRRGGGQRLLSLDVRDAEGTLVSEPATAATPEDEFERRWALTVLDEALNSLAIKYSSRGKSEIFDTLASYLSLEGAETKYQDTASQLGMTPGAVKVAVHRLRREYRDQLRQVVAETVQDKNDVANELETLLRALSK
ncbi:RNA polymerase sigma factor [Novipirellula sp. SH528]|uniref:RNA polymerase sigma factor n=1 Tax=Novipirellula sp. SH528 TaxID=3454466 RepID=UPI003FA06D10